jgi:NADH-quinone oxidoreductase subunit F
MDLRAIAEAPSNSETAAVDAVLGPAPVDIPTPASVAKGQRTLLLPCLHALQSGVGWVSPGGLGYVCRRLGIPPAEAYGVASFYAMFSLTQRPSAFAHVCDDIVCQTGGGEQLCEELTSRFGGPLSAHHRADAPDSAPAHSSARWARSPCLGLCDQAPAAMVSVAGAKPLEFAFGSATTARIESALNGAPPRWTPAFIGGAGPRKLLVRAGLVDPSSLDAYQAHGGQRALRRALEIGREGVVREVSEAKLVGRGGAAFPTGRKWEAVARAPEHPHYVVCNADESEPGTFKDRVLMESDPFAVLEAMTIAGFATGSERGYLYIRGEYPTAAARLEHAIESLRAKQWLRAPILGSDFVFDIELRRGAGAYICGEETALFNSLEGFRGEPRNKPPFPVNSGLFRKPTSVNNVETLVAVLDIVRDGAASYASVGTAGSPGTKLFCVCGRVARPGVYEVPFGTRLDALIELAGGVAKGRRIQAVLLGGAASTFLTPDELSVPLSFEDTRKIGASLGSGVVFILDDEVPLAPILRRLAAFFRDESCGQCVPCRVGTVRQEELLARLAAGTPLGSSDAEIKLLTELAQAMKDASICGLGQTATLAIQSALAKLIPPRGPNP